ncbi:hypothetical protein ABZU25_28840 [Micromonospora sp. NPDC005215]|uniref:hypothetical protein n=1 Tax=Micromonospora sp. NPDC005215 TaxID=3157024 RepID=UPI00339EA911
MLHDSQLLLGMSRHLSGYSVSPAHAALESLQFAGQVYEMAWRLRNSQVSSAERIEAIGIEAKIGPRQLRREILPTLEQLGWVEVERDNDGHLLSISAFIPPGAELVDASGQMLDIVMATEVQRAALTILRATSVQPLEREAALQAASSQSDEAAEEALRHLISINLVRHVASEDGRVAVFNPNIFAGDEKIALAALKTEDARVRTEVGALLEEVSAAPGIPEPHVTSTEQRWIDFAVSIGLVERSVVQTNNGDEKRFLFSPHLGRDPFGIAAGDPSGHVRQLVGSMIYASTFASWPLRSPGAFLHVLIRDGEAGNHIRVAEDYPMLETAGTIQVVGTGHNSRMRLLQADVAEAALAIIDSRGAGHYSDTVERVALGDQRSYTHLERERAQLASEVSLDDEHGRRMIAALRDAAARRDF